MKYLPLLILLTSCSYYPQDNLIEEFAEDYIEDKTGIYVDFSGSSKE